MYKYYERIKAVESQRYDDQGEMSSQNLHRIISTHLLTVLTMRAIT